jgi:hypothetical protein
VQTTLLLMARYDGAVIIPLATVCRDFFSHLAPEKLERKILAGKIVLPIVRMDSSSQKTAKVSTLTTLPPISTDRPRRHAKSAGNSRPIGCRHEHAPPRRPAHLRP